MDIPDPSGGMVPSVVPPAPPQAVPPASPEAATGLTAFRKQYPQYNDMTDTTLSDLLYKKYYADMPRDQFNTKLGYNPKNEMMDQLAEGFAGYGGGTNPTTDQTGVPLEIAKGVPIAGAYVPSNAATESFEKEMPAAAATMRGIGSAAALAPAMAAAPELFGLNAAKSLIPNVLTGTGTGVALGGADAAARGEPIVQGAVTGGLTAGAAPVGGKIIGAAFKGIANLLSPEASGVLKGINPLALEKASTAAKAAGLTDESIANMINTKGPNAFLMEYSPEMFGQGAGIAAEPGAAGKNAILGAYAERGAPEAVSARINKGINEGLGEPTNLTQAGIENVAQREKEFGPLFDKFRSMKVQPTEDVKKLTADLEPLGLFKDANQVALEEAAATGKPVSPTQNFFTTGDQKDWPTTQSWSYVKQAVDKKIANSYDQNGMATALTRRMRQIKARIDDAIGNSSPETKAVWDAAREGWEGSKALDNARLEGSKVWNPNYTKDQLIQDLTDMSPAERQAHREGARAALSEQAGKVAETGDTNVAKMLRADNNKAKFSYMSTRNGYNPEPFLNDLDHLAQEKTAQKSLGNSVEKEAIAKGKQQMTANPKDLASHKAGELYSMHVTPLKVPLAPITAYLQRRQVSQYEAMRDALGKLYTKQGPEAQEVARALLNYKTNGAGAPQAGLTTAGVASALARPNTPGVPLPFLAPGMGGTQ